MSYMDSVYAKEISSIPLLSEDETNYLLKETKNGNKSAREKLIKHNLRMVLNIANRFIGSTNLGVDELISIGSIGLIKAIDSYEFGHDSNLVTYAYECIYNEIFKYFKVLNAKKRTGKKVISIYEPFHSNETDERLVTYEGTVKDDNVKDEDELIESIILKDALTSLSDEELKIVYHRYFIGRKPTSYKEIASLLGISYQAIQQKEKKLLLKLRDRL